MQFRLRTLLILLAVLPPLIAFPLAGLAYAIAAAVPGFLLFLIYLPAILDAMEGPPKLRTLLIVLAMGLALYAAGYIGRSSVRRAGSSKATFRCYPTPLERAIYYPATKIESAVIGRVVKSVHKPYDENRSRLPRR
jgi:hypothetical protein